MISCAEPARRKAHINVCVHDNNVFVEDNIVFVDDNVSVETSVSPHRAYNLSLNELAARHWVPTGAQPLLHKSDDGSLRWPLSRCARRTKVCHKIFLHLVDELRVEYSMAASVYTHSRARLYDYSHGGRLNVNVLRI
jgi:hypothetical protein